MFRKGIAAYSILAGFLRNIEKLSIWNFVLAVFARILNIISEIFFDGIRGKLQRGSCGVVVRISVFGLCNAGSNPGRWIFAYPGRFQFLFLLALVDFSFFRSKVPGNGEKKHRRRIFVPFVLKLSFFLRGFPWPESRKKRPAPKAMQRHEFKT